MDALPGGEMSEGTGQCVPKDRRLNGGSRSYRKVGEFIRKKRELPWAALEGQPIVIWKWKVSAAY